MDAEVNQVLTVCPDVNIDDVVRDLNCTGSAEATINRIFEGTVSAYVVSVVQGCRIMQPGMSTLTPGQYFSRSHTKHVKSPA